MTRRAAEGSWEERGEETGGTEVRGGLTCYLYETADVWSLGCCFDSRVTGGRKKRSSSVGNARLMIESFVRQHDTVKR